LGGKGIFPRSGGKKQGAPSSWRTLFSESVNLETQAWDGFPLSWGNVIYSV